MKRRDFLLGMLAAPAIVRASSLMPVVRPSGIVLPPEGLLLEPDYVQQLAGSMRRAQRFFDTVMYTGDGAQSRIIHHWSGERPAFVIIRARPASAAKSER